MLAQWVPLHAVSCSNLIETGGCAESREIPLRVTQNLGLVAHDGVPPLRMLSRPREYASRRMRLHFGVSSRLLDDRARASSYLRDARVS